MSDYSSPEGDCSLRNTTPYVAAETAEHNAVRFILRKYSRLEPYRRRLHMELVVCTRHNKPAAHERVARLIVNA